MILHNIADLQILSFLSSREMSSTLDQTKI